MASPGAPGSLRWKFDPEAKGTWSGASIAADGTVYVSLCQGADKGAVYALEPIAGSVLWQFHSACFSSTPAVGPDGTVYVGGGDSRVYAFNPDGTSRWIFQGGSTFDASPALAVDGTVYVGSNDGKLYALDGTTGTKRWEFTTGGAVHEAPSIALDGTVYTGSGDGRLYALDGATGAEKWAFPTGGPIVCSPAIGDDGTVYFGSADRKVYAVNGGPGTKRWDFATTAPVDWSPAIAHEMVVVGSNDGVMYSLEADTGETCWDLEFIEPITRAHPMLGTDGNLYFGAISWLIAVDHITKASPWSYATLGVHNSSPIVGPDGTIFFGSDNGPFYALWSSCVGGLADSSWPVAGQNVRRTGQAPGKPVIFNQPLTQLVRLGDAVTLSAIAVGAPPLSFQWMLNGTPFVKATNSALILTNLQSAMLGDYTLAVTNRLGAVTSDPASVRITAPPTIQFDPQSQTSSVGSSVKFSVAANGSRPLTYQWQFQGTNLSGATESQLSLTNVTSADAGVYRAVVSNSAGSITSAGALLKVITPAALGIGLDGQVFLTGSLGSSYRIESTDDLGSRAWTLLTNVTLTASPINLSGGTPANRRQSFYRALTSE